MARPSIVRAWRRKLAAAEARGDEDMAERLRGKLGESEATPEPDDSLDAVEFASQAARDAAEEADLTAEDFKRQEQSSDNGFIKADVERIVAAGNGNA